uniref:Uncharacterized protein n=3 Tax=Ceratitis capitata TaxID=7213 RepID=W8C2A3_CERCA
MVNKYKHYKLNRLDVIPNGAHDAEKIQKITQEWEFFEPIHRFMSQKTTNLHSYALPVTVRIPVPPSAALDEDDGSSNCSPYGLDEYSSDNNYVFNANTPNARNDALPNTDHDFYTKKNGLPLNYFADESNDTQESMLVEQPITCNGVTEGMEQVRLHIAGEQIVEMKMESQCDTLKTATIQVQQHQQQVFNDTNMPSTSAGCSSRLRNLQRRTIERPLNERERYYRHKRHFNRRLEQRFDALLNVFGQVIKAEYPNINVSPILGAAAQGVTLANQLFKSDDESVDEENESSSSSEQFHVMGEETNEDDGNQNAWQNH